MPALLRLRAALPFGIESPVMREADEVARFTALMERHGVLAVLSGPHSPESTHIRHAPGAG